MIIENHNVVITGACGEIGQSMVEDFISKNYKVIGIDLNNETLEELAAKWPNSFIPVQMDLSKVKEIKNNLEQIIQEHDVPHIWINNVGISHVGPMEQFTIEQIKLQMDLHFFSAAEFARLILPKMEARGYGIFANMASTAGHVPCPYLSTYCASKHALVGLTKSLQVEHNHRKSPVKICLISPGFLDSSILQKGEKYGFPEKFDFLLEDPKKCAKKIVKKIISGKSFIDPTMNGKFLRVTERFAPAIVNLASRAAAAKNLKQFLGFNKI